MKKNNITKEEEKRILDNFFKNFFSDLKKLDPEINQIVSEKQKDLLL